MPKAKPKEPPVIKRCSCGAMPPIVGVMSCRRATAGKRVYIACLRCGRDSDTGKKQAIAAWNTRPAPPVGRCGTCKRNHLRGGKWFCEVRGIVHDLDDFCSYYEPKEANNAD